MFTKPKSVTISSFTVNGRLYFGWLLLLLHLLLLLQHLLLRAAAVVATLGQTLLLLHLPLLSWDGYC